MSSTNLQQQLFRYAQDLHELMAQQSNLQQRYQMVLQSLGQGGQNNDLLHGVLLPSIELHLATDLKGEIISASPAAIKALTATSGALIGQSILQLTPNTQQASLQAVLETFVANDSECAMQQRTLHLFDSEQPRQFEALVMQVCKNGRNEIYWLLGRETLTVTSALEIQKSFPFFGDSDEGLMIIDPTGNLQAVNPAFTRITGYSEADVIGQNLNLLSSGLHDPDFYQTFWAHLVDIGSWTGELFTRRKNGQIFLSWQAVKAVKDANGETVSYIAAFADMSPHTSDIKQLTQLAYHDSLTGLPNRRLLEERLKQAMTDASRASTGLSVLFLDLNHFKSINDELGHEVGDMVLQMTGTRLLAAVRRGDTVARVGGDEFVVLLQNVDSTAIIESIVNALLETLAVPILAGQHQLSVGASIGCARFPQDGRDMATLLKNADAAMYGAKRFGTHFCFYEIGSVASSTQASVP